MKLLNTFQLALWTLMAGAPAALGSDSAALDPSTLCERLQIIEEVLVFDKSGTRIIDIYRNDRGPGGSRLGNDKESDVACGRGSSSGFSSSSFNRPIFFHHEWSVQKDGTLAVTYEQGSGFSGHGREAKLENSTGQKTLAIKDFQTVSWVSPFHTQQRLVVRLTPTLGENHRIREVGNFPLFLSDTTIFDGSGNLWTANLTASGDFVGVLTVEGALVLSFQPFEQGTQAGKASGKEIRLSLPDGESVLLRSSEPILPGDLAADIYIMHDPELKAKDFGSQSVSSGSDAKEVIGKLRRHVTK